jgi:hypothetical protein
MTPRQKFICTVLGILVPALVSLGTVYLNSVQAKANATAALERHDRSLPGHYEPLPLEPPVDSRYPLTAERIEGAAVRREYVEDRIDTTDVTIQPTGFERLIGQKARVIPANRLRASLRK